jgi:Lon protease-like protein
MPTEVVIPLFPLGVVLFPDMPLPLHIFEERYKTMVRECLAEDKAFGVVYFGGDHMHRIGCTAKILEVLNRYDDGCLDILTKGEKRFSIKALYEDKPYLQAKIVHFEEPVEKPSAELEVLAAKGLGLLKQLTRSTESEERAVVSGNPDFMRLSFLIAGNDGFTPSEKQKFLEMTSTHDRLKKSVESLSRMLKGVEITKEIQRIIGGNGKVPRSLAEKVQKDG